MRKRVLSLLLCAALLVDLSGCSRSRVVKARPEVAPDVTDEQIVAITTKHGEFVEFEATKGEGAWGDTYAYKSHAVVRNDSLFGIVNKAPYKIALTDVQHLWLEEKEFSTGLTIAAVVGVAAAAFFLALLIAAATYEDPNPSSSSCPYVYSWDGSQYVFDAEPYAGAVSRGLERDDFSALENLQVADGSYHLRFANRMPETDCTNLVELLLLDHAPGQRLAVDAGGWFHDISSARPLLAATGEAGQDLRAWLVETDKLIWEPPPEATSAGGVRTEIVMTFPRPAGSEQAKLVANVQTGTWGAMMIRELLDLHGSQLPAIHAAIDGAPALQDSLRAWNEREELFLLKVEVEEADGWHVRGFVPGGGQAPENIVVPLDIHNVQGETLRLRIHPPVGFWALNSFAVDYSAPGPPLDVRVVAPIEAVDQQGNDILPQLLTTDDAYHVMPETGNWANIVFPAPALPRGRERTIFLHSRGYYQLHLDAEHEPDTARLEQIANVPDAAARFSVERFAHLRAVRTQQR